MSKCKINKPITPIYADAGRKQRVEQKGGRAYLAWAEHCQALGIRMVPLADDRLSTRESCCKPDTLTEGRAVELMITDWGDYPFPYPYMNVPFHKLKYAEKYPDGGFVLMNEHETYAVSVPMSEAVKYDEIGWYPDNYGEPMKHARIKVERCRVFKLGKIEKLKN